MTDEVTLKKHFWKHLSDSPIVMIGHAAGGHHSEPLTAQLDPDQADTLFFFIGSSNRLASGGRVMAQFVSRGHEYFACLSGATRTEHDIGMIQKLWSPQVEAWFPGGKGDPNLLLLRFDIEDAELWEADMSLSGKVKMLFGGKIKPGEEGSHARVSSTVI